MSNSVVGALRVTLGLDSASFERGLSGAQKTLNQFGRRMERLSANVAGLGQTLTLGLTLPIVALGTKMTKTAIDAAEMQSAFEVSFGGMAQAAKAWADATGNVMGRSTTEMQSAMLTMHGLFKAGGPATEQTRKLAEQFAVLSQDLSSFHNVSPEDALDRLRAGLSGEAEPLRRFNVYLTEAAVKAEALRMGLVKGKSALSETAKIQARASLIMKGTTEAQGDVIRTSGSAANQIRSLGAAWQELSMVIGEKIVPLITPVVAGLKGLATKFSAMGPAGQTLTLVLAGVAAAAGPVLLVTAALINAMGVLAVSMGRTGAVGGVLGATFARLAVAMSALSLANLRTVFSTTALTAAFMGQSTAMALLAATGRTLAVVFMSLGRGLLALVGGPIGLAIIAIAALVMNIGRADRENKKLIETMGGASGALDEYEQAALAAATATGENRKEAVKNAAAMRQEALDAIKAARALRERTAALAADLAAAADRRAAESRSDTGRSAALGVRSGIYEGAQAQADAARAKAEAAAKAVSAAEKRLKEIEANINAVAKAAAGGADAIDDIADSTKKAKKEATDYAAELEAMRRSLAAPTQQAITDTTDKIALLTEGLKAGKYTAYEVAQALRMINEALDRDKFGDAVAKIDQSADLEDGPPKVVTFGGRVMSEETAEDLRQQMTDTFRGALDALRGGGVEGVFQYLADTFANRLLDRLADDLTTLLDQILTQIGTANGGAGGGLGAILSTVFGGGKVPGFATGGSFKVGGSGGIDSQLMQFRATPGEMVDIRHGNDNGRRGATNVFDMRGAVVTQDLLDQMNAIAAQGDMQVIGAIQKERTREQQARRYTVAR